MWVLLKHPYVLPLHGTVSGFGQLPALVSTWMHNGALHGYLQRMELTMERKLQLVRFIVSELTPPLNGRPYPVTTDGGWPKISYIITIPRKSLL